MGPILKTERSSFVARVKKQKYSSALKAKVAVDAIRGEKTTVEIASKHAVHPSRVSKWKTEALKRLPEIFTEGRVKNDIDKDCLVDELYKQIGQLKVELDWLKKKNDYLS